MDWKIKAEPHWKTIISRLMNWIWVPHREKQRLSMWNQRKRKEARWKGESQESKRNKPQRWRRNWWRICWGSHDKSKQRWNEWVSKSCISLPVFRFSCENLFDAQEEKEKSFSCISLLFWCVWCCQFFPRFAQSLLSSCSRTFSASIWSYACFFLYASFLIRQRWFLAHVWFPGCLSCLPGSLLASVLFLFLSLLHFHLIVSSLRHLRNQYLASLVFSKLRIPPRKNFSSKMQRSLLEKALNSLLQPRLSLLFAFSIHLSEWCDTNREKRSEQLLNRKWEGDELLHPFSPPSRCFCLDP